VHQSHFNLAADWKMPVSILRHLERDDAVIHNAIVGSEALKKLELHITHGGKEFPVILGGSFLPGEGSIKAIQGRCFPKDVIGKRLKRRFNLIQRFALEVILHGRQILGYAVSIHRAFSSLAV
jgi:hypothetical protein